MPEGYFFIFFWDVYTPCRRCPTPVSFASRGRTGNTGSPGGKTIVRNENGRRRVSLLLFFFSFRPGTTRGHRAYTRTRDVFTRLDRDPRKTPCARVACTRVRHGAAIDFVPDRGPRTLYGYKSYDIPYGGARARACVFRRGQRDNMLMSRARIHQCHGRECTYIYIYTYTCTYRHVRV